MLKWTASAQKLGQNTSATLQTSSSTLTTVTTPCLTKTKRHKRRATIANKENIPNLTSTPMISRTRNSPLVFIPLADILNVTPESKDNGTPERRRVTIHGFNEPTGGTRRRHSTVGFSVPQIPQYAATLPKYEEEYSPSTILPTGQQLALRGLLPDPFMDNPRYFNTNEKPVAQDHKLKRLSSVGKKRKLEAEFLALENDAEQNSNKKDFNNTGLVSNKMGDQTLDHLIDAILDSARKDEKKKKPRKSFNLRRRTLLKNQQEQYQNNTLSPSYTAGDDPCSDVSFLNCETKPITPQPANSIPNTPQTHRLLLQMPTPPRSKDSFSLDTPVRTKLKRRSESNARPSKSAKKYKVDSNNYFEIGVALPSIYV